MKPVNVLIVRRDGHAKIVAGKALKCSCGVMHCFFINRGGKTRCLECDRNYIDSLLDKQKDKGK